MKQLAGDNTSSNGFRTFDSNITAIKHSNVEPSAANKTANNIVSTSDSKVPIYMWYDSGKIYWWSNDSSPNLNVDFSHMFRSFNNLTDISGLSDLDTSLTVNLTSSFAYDAKLEDMSPISNWNVKNVTTLQTAFTGVKLHDASAFAKWKTSSLENLAAAFQNCTYMSSLEGFENWDTSKVTTMFITFASTTDNGNTRKMSISSLTPLHKWNTDSVTDIRGMFQYNNVLTSLNGLENRNVSKVTSISSLFEGCTALTSANPLGDWNVGQVTEMISVFDGCSNLTTVSELGSWNTSKVTTMYAMFDNDVKFGNISALSNWDTSKVNNIGYMFDACYKAEGTFAIKGNVTSYDNAFTNAGRDTTNGITVNYASSTSNINNIISTKGSGKVSKGSLIS